MRNDERLTQTLQAIKTIGYHIFWFGLFAILLFRWFYMDQSLMETIDIFILWIGASMITFILSAVRGIPMSYPMSITKKERKLMILTTSLSSAALSAILVAIFNGETRRIILAFLFTFIITTSIFLIYDGIHRLWEKKIDES